MTIKARVTLLVNHTAIAIKINLTIVNFVDPGKMVLTGSYGKGPGRYLPGINGTAGYLDNIKIFN